MMDIPEEAHELYATFGLVAEKAQLLEIDAGNVALAWLAVWYKPETITEAHREMFRGVTKDLNRKTLGALLKSIKSIGTFSDSILDAVDQALERRNYLTHRFFRTHNFAIFSAEGRQAMVEELTEIAGKIELGRAMLIGVAGTLEQLAGIDSAAAENVGLQLMTDAKKVDIEIEDAFQSRRAAYCVAPNLFNTGARAQCVSFRS